MPGRTPTLAAWLAAFWRALSPGGDVVDPEVNTLDQWRVAFAWRGAALTFDRRSKQVLRGGRTLARLADIKSVDIQHVHWNDDQPEYWKVSLGTGSFSGVEIGRTRDDAEASIAAARLATVAGVKVRAL